jgi:PAS domain S-box-containing protein
MPARPDDLAEEIKGLRRCIGDLLGLAALPASWTGADPVHVARTVLDTLREILVLDLLFVRLIHPSTGLEIDECWLAAGRGIELSTLAVAGLVGRWLADERRSAGVLRERIGTRTLSVITLPIGARGDSGVVVAAAEKQDFPSQAERLMLTVARNQTAIALQEAKLREEQRRLAETLDRKVALRTAELAAANEGLRRSEAFLAEAQRLSLTGSFSWRMGSDQIEWSDEVYRIFGFERASPITFERLEARIHPDDLTLFRSVVDRARSDGSGFEFEPRLLMPDGAVKYLHVVAHAARSRDSDLEYIGAVQDVTERHRSIEDLDRARTELARVARITSLGTLAASIAHEVSQPIAGVVTNASTSLKMLSADPPNLDGARETMRRAVRDGHRASEVVTRLRELFTKKEVVEDLVDLSAAAREVIALTREELRRSRVTTREELRDDLPRVPGDRIQLQQVILNLLLNAADAMKGIEGRARDLLVRTERDECGVRLSVQDSGIGFAHEDADRLFEAFYSTKSQGMGIGLSVSRSIIEKHRGRLWATQNKGPGATFTFAIPLETIGPGKPPSVA